jgi:hypothetical protein
MQQRLKGLKKSAKGLVRFERCSLRQTTNDGNRGKTMEKTYEIRDRDREKRKDNRPMPEGFRGLIGRRSVSEVPVIEFSKFQIKLNLSID